MTQPNPKLDWPIAYEAVCEIARSEGCRLKAYRCPAGVPTIGWGHTRGVKMGDTCTQEQADAWFLEDLSEFTEGVRRLYEARGQAEKELSRMALGRFGQVDDIAQACAYLASPAASFITGCDLTVDGGRALKRGWV